MYANGKLSFGDSLRKRMKMYKLRVSALSESGKVAAAVAGVISEKEVELHSIGAGALNNALKAVIYASRMAGKEIFVVPRFETMDNGKTGVVLCLKTEWIQPGATL